MENTKYYTANYTYTNPNFVIQNLQENSIQSEHLATFYIVKNLLQRGFPAMMSQFLQEKLGVDELHKAPNFKNSLVLIDTETPKWYNTIKGHDITNKFPALEFFEKLIPQYLGEYAFVQSLILPEVLINDITEQETQEYVKQQVDFYLPQAKLVIEIDGAHHKEEPQKTLDINRNKHLEKIGVKTIRIPTEHINNKDAIFISKVEEVKEHLSGIAGLKYYQASYNKVQNNSFSPEEIQEKLLPTAIIRFQLLVLELLIHQKLSIEAKEWRLNLHLHKAESFLHDLRFVHWAIEDLFLWIENLCILRTVSFVRPEVKIEKRDSNSFHYQQNCIYVDFSLLKRYTDEHELKKQIVFVRNDYFGTEKNYFQASTTTPITYEINQDEGSPQREALRFFLQNIFGKEKQDFRDGQLPIIANALKMRESTVGLLPTGGGKSLCYQLPCLLQPSINFVVCPIKSLMSDQKDNLDKLLITNTSFISGDLEREGELDEAQRKFADGRFLFVWISPERFQIPKFRAYLDTVVAKYHIAYAVIDEVHCMSEWGHDFRTSYLNLVPTIREKCEGTKIIGLTATASKNVLTDIEKTFDIKDRNDIKSKLDFSRKELEFHIIKDEGNKYDCLQETMKDLGKEGFMHDDKQAGLIFTPHVNGDKGCYWLSNRLNGKYKGKVKWYSGSVPAISASLNIMPDKDNDSIWEIYLNGGKKLPLPKKDITNFDKMYDILVDLLEAQNTPILDVDILKKEVQKIVNNATISPVNIGGRTIVLGESIIEGDEYPKIPIMPDTEFTPYKKKVQKDFKDNKFPLMVATKAFGMGIDKNNIHYTFHYGLPSSLESLYQEAGRAGRWENKEQKAHCYVLYSQVVNDEKGLLESIFKKETLPEEVQKLQKEGKEKGDVFTQMFLFATGLRKFEEETRIIMFLIDNYFNKNITEIYWRDVESLLFQQKQIKITEKTDGIIEKSIYRLQILGIVKDWEVDYRNQRYKLYFWVGKEGKSIDTRANLIEHIVKYDVGKEKEDIKKEIEAVGNIESLKDLPKDKETLEQFKTIYYLLQWTWDAIAYNRRKSLQDMMILCDKNLSSEEFKRAIDQVFQITEITFIIQYISQKEGINKYNKWFEVLYTEKKNEKDIPEYMPAIQDIKRKKGEFERLQRNMSSYMQSYRDNYGLNFISGITQLFLNEYEKQDGKINLESALHRIKNVFPIEQNYIINQLIDEIGIHLPAQNQEELVESILLHYPEKQEYLAEKYDMPWLLTEKLIPKLQRFQTLNQQYYDQIGKI